MKFNIYIDEAWRGPLAWPVYVGLVLPLQKIDWDWFDDSKKLSEHKRENLFGVLQDWQTHKKLIWSYWFAEADEIDKLGISGALNLAIKRGLWELGKRHFEIFAKPVLQSSSFGDDQVLLMDLEDLFTQRFRLANQNRLLQKMISKLWPIKSQLEAYTDYRHMLGGVFLDWNNEFGLNKDLKLKIKTIVDGDAKIPAIGAASVIAKVLRDKHMKKLAKKFPMYGFETHKGYGTKFHREQIIQNWAVSGLHRQKFIRNLNCKIIKNNFKPAKFRFSLIKKSFVNKPKLLLHTCCAPDLAWPLRFLKNYFDLYLFWYNPNIHPFSEHKKRYGEYQKLTTKEMGDFKILEDWYEPKEFFDYLENRFQNSKKEMENLENLKVNGKLSKAVIMKELAKMKEKASNRCWWCYELRLEKAAQIAVKHNIDFFSTTLLISPKKDYEHLFEAWKKAEEFVGGKSKFLFFDFRKNKWYEKAVEITKEYNIRRQNYCGCGWSIQKTPR